MVVKRSITTLFVALLFLFSVPVFAEVQQVKLYFGLSIPGGGAVSLNAWQQFEEGDVAQSFDGFNVMDSVGYYKGVPERSKVVTIVVEGQAEIDKAKALAERYADRFNQESVMFLLLPVNEWDFIGPQDK